MIQFLGVHLDSAAAHVTILGRDRTLSARSSARMLHASPVQAPGTSEGPPPVEIPPAEWVRAGTYALQEAYFQLPVSKRKPWGIALSAPSGWIGLDLEFKPLSPLRLVAGPAVASDIVRWIAETSRAAKRLSVVLSPKDYFRFAVSGALAADVTDASRMKLLRRRASHWSRRRVTEAGLSIQWLPPVFDSPVQTGRITEDGMRRTCLPGGTWLVAGAHELEAEVVACGPPGGRDLWILGRSGAAEPTCAYVVPSDPPPKRPKGWRLFRSALPGYSILEARLPAGADEDAAGALRTELEGSGHEVHGVRASCGSAADGAALLALIASGLVRDWERYFDAPPQQPGDPA